MRSAQTAHPGKSGLCVLTYRDTIRLRAIANGQYGLSVTNRHAIGRGAGITTWLEHRWQHEPMGLIGTCKAILHRLKMMNVDDTSVAVKHAYGVRHPGAAFDMRSFRDAPKRTRYRTTAEFPMEMSVRPATLPGC